MGGACLGMTPCSALKPETSELKPLAAHELHLAPQTLGLHFFSSFFVRLGAIRLPLYFALVEPVLVPGEELLADVFCVDTAPSGSPKSRTKLQPSPTPAQTQTSQTA
jgi:hypothetical protein